MTTMQMKLPPPLPSARKKKRTLRTVLIAVPLGIVGLLVVILAVGVFMDLTATEEPPSQAERQLVVDIELLAEFLGGFEPRLEHQTAVKRTFLDSSYEIDYLYDNPEEAHPYIECCLAVDTDVMGAEASYFGMWSGSKMGIHLTAEVDVEIAERNDLFSWGDQSRFAILQVDGQPTGYLFVARKGKKVFHLLIGGVYLDEVSEFKSLVEPVLMRVQLHVSAD
jgi:hypothetical protein